MAVISLKHIYSIYYYLLLHLLHFIFSKAYLFHLLLFTITFTFILSIFIPYFQPFLKKMKFFEREINL